VVDLERKFPNCLWQHLGLSSTIQLKSFHITWKKTGVRVMGRTPSKSYFLPFFFTGVIKLNLQQFGNLPVDVISLKSKDKGAERLSAMALISTIGMSSGQLLHFLISYHYFGLVENKSLTLHL
jgi:hypothetical protein